MQVISFSDLRKNMRSVMNGCCENHELTIVTRQKEPPIVMLSLDDYNALEETLYLMKNPNNYAHLLQAIKNVRNGKVNPHDLLED